MLTAWGRALKPDNILPEYPRPQLRRARYQMLNGYWNCAVTKSALMPKTFPYRILVPFSPESSLAKFSHHLKDDEYLWYQRTVTIPQSWRDKVLVHFDAVDQQADVFFDGEHVASHAGGYLPFFCTLEHAKAGQQVSIVVRVRDMTDKSWHSRGKQKTKRGGIWYTPQSGIWQSVWMEPVPETYIEGLRITPRYDEELLDVTVKCERITECSVTFRGKTYEGDTNEVITLEAKGLSSWSPDNPVLYDFSAQLGQDVVESYFAMRKFSVEKCEDGIMRLMLNNEPIFHTGLLDQGYWPDGLYTAPDDKALIYDIQLAKSMGFNVLRKHIKVEPLRWYYHCDRLGMIVWQDMPCGGGKYNPLIVTTPVVTGMNIPDRFYRLFGRQNQEGRNQYRRELQEMIEHLYNCPCIGMWVPFNEGWGQFDAAKTLELVQKLDQTRTVDHASGWHDQKVGDFKSLHVYFRPYKFKPDKLGRCVILTEFGGFSHAVKGHSHIARKEFGYKKEESLADFEQSMIDLYQQQIVPAKNMGLSAAILTQLSDVEDEVNGLVTYDRQVVKIPTKTIRKLNSHLHF